MPLLLDVSVPLLACKQCFRGFQHACNKLWHTCPFHTLLPMQIFARFLGIMLVDLHDRLAVGVAEFLGQDDLDFGQQIAGRAVLGRHAVAFHAEFGAARRAGRHVHAYRAARRGHVDLCARRRLAQRDRHLDEQVVAAALKKRMRRDADGHQDIARRAAARRGLALAADADFFAVLDAGGIFTAIVSVLPDWRLHGKLHLAAADGRGEGDLHFADDIGAASRAGRGFRRPAARRRGGTGRTCRRIRPGAPPPNRSPKNWLKSMSSGLTPAPLKPAARTAAPSVGVLRSARPASLERTAVAVVHFPLFRVAQHVEGRLDLLEFLLRRLVVGIFVGMVFFGQLVIGLLDLGLRGLARTPRVL